MEVNEVTNEFPYAHTASSLPPSLKDFFRKSEFTAEESKRLQDDVYCASLPKEQEVTCYEIFFAYYRFPSHEMNDFLRFVLTLPSPLPLRK